MATRTGGDNGVVGTSVYTYDWARRIVAIGLLAGFSSAVPDVRLAARRPGRRPAGDHTDQEIESLTIDGETIETTPDHRFLTETGWVEAAALYPGTKVVRLDGSTGTVDGYAIEVRPVIMWDLTVSDVHTFAVGEGQWVVHNCGESAAAAAGREIHQRTQIPGWKKEYGKIPGIRPDFVNFELRTVLELKPNNWQAIRKGLRQLSRYLDELNRARPGEVPWTGQVITYDP